MTQSSSPSADANPATHCDLARYTLRVRCPREWDDEMLTAVADPLTDLVESTLAAVKQHIEEAHPDLVVEVED